MRINQSIFAIELFLILGNNILFSGTGGIDYVTVIAPSVSTRIKARKILMEAGWQEARLRQAQAVMVVVRSSIRDPLKESYDCYKELLEDAEGQLNISGSKYHIYLYVFDDDLNLIKNNHINIEAQLYE